MELTLYGRPITKKNSPRIIKVGNYHKVIPSKQYLAYEKDCLKQITGKYKQNIDHKINLKCLYYMPTRHKVDISNLMSASHDILTEAGVINDDNSKIIGSVDGSRVLYDKNNPRVEMFISDFEKDQINLHLSNNEIEKVLDHINNDICDNSEESRALMKLQTQLSQVYKINTGREYS